MVIKILRLNEFYKKIKCNITKISTELSELIQNNNHSVVYIRHHENKLIEILDNAYKIADLIVECFENFNKDYNRKCFGKFHKIFMSLQHDCFKCVIKITCRNLSAKNLKEKFGGINNEEGSKNIE